jgi:hypothetical protein
MNCYDCNSQGHARPAVAICHDCGAAPHDWVPTRQRRTAATRN